MNGFFSGYLADMLAIKIQQICDLNMQVNGKKEENPNFKINLLASKCKMAR